jgi:RNA polymerase sigma-70 factor (ECF subfamily)
LIGFCVIVARDWKVGLFFASAGSNRPYQAFAAVSQPSSNPTLAPSAPPCVGPPADPEVWFKEEVHPHDGQLKSWLRRTFPSVRDVDDVVQDSYVCIWKAKMAEMTKPIVSTKAYLFTVARNLAVSVIRREARSPVTYTRELAELGVLEDKPTAAQALTEQERFELFTDALAALPARTRAIIFLNKFEGITQTEIAKRLGLSEKAIEYHVKQGVQLCTAYFHAHGHDRF